MDVQKKLDEIVAAVGSARSMPMSASCVMNRAELLAMLEEVREALPGSLAQAEELIGDRAQVVAEARHEADRIIESARAERGSLVSGTEVARQSQAESDRILNEARREAEEVRAEADDYVDSKLANFEVVLTKTLGSVGRGREKLLGTGDGIGADGYEDPDYADAPERSQDPETLRQRADAYVDVKLGAFEAVLAKTLEAVGRGRQKLHGRVASDELAALADGGPSGGHTTDEEFLADLAETSTARPPRQPQEAPAPYGADDAEPQPAYAPQDAGTPPPYAPGAPQPAYAAAQGPQDPYGAQDGAQQPYGAQDPYAAYQAAAYGTDGAGYAYQEQDPYGYQTGQQPAYGGQDAYGYPQQQDPYATYPQQQGYDAAGEQQYARGDQQGAGALDETSLFDTSMISREQLRQYEQGR
ncbi:cell division initiation protein [Streptomyces sp. NPDC050560]|uniref:cell division initiation protein n=1 Tax=Streptomyces sp. NPDC050560 TaxID=3365630 RepID=UPI0037BABBA4